MKRLLWAGITLAAGLWLGAASWAQVEFPKGLKDVAPVPPGATVLQAMEMTDGSHAVMEGSTPPKDVIAFYRKAMEGKGWKMEMEMNQKDNALVVFSKGGQALTVMADGSGGKKTTIALTLGKK
jgi:hypothetical protein